MVRRFSHCRTLWASLLFAAVLWPASASSAAPYPHVTVHEPGDTKAVILYADAIRTWTQDGDRVALLRGAVLVEHDMFRAQMDNAVVWFKQDQLGVLKAQIFADGNVHLDGADGSSTAARAFVEIFTRGQPQLRAVNGSIVDTPAPDDPLYRAALAERSADAPVPAAAIQQTSAAVPAADPIAAPEPVTPVQGPVPGSIVPPQVPQAPPAPPTLQPLPQPTTTPPVPPPGGTAPSPRAPTPGPTPARTAPVRQIQLVPRNRTNYQETVLQNGEQAVVITGGVILLVRNPAQNVGMLDIEADNVVIWYHGNFQDLMRNLHSSEGEQSREIEVYLQGDVELREQNANDNRVIRAEEVYYDVQRNVAVAYQSDLEFKQPGLPDPIHVRAHEVQQLSLSEFQAFRAEVYSSRLPSSPGLRIVVTEGTLVRKRVPKRSIFGRQYYNRKTGQPEYEEQDLFRGTNSVLRLEDIPVFYFPYIQGDANDPLGPLRSIRMNYNSEFGFQLLTTFNVYDLLGMDPIPGTHWTLDVDYLSARGPALGTNYDYAGKDLFDLPGAYFGTVRAYGIYDTGKDILGGDRNDEPHPDARGRLLVRHYEEFPDGFTVYAQLGLQSDQNFLEEYFYQEFATDVDEATFIDVKQQQGNWAWTLLAQPNVRPWLTETQWLPRADGYLIGQSFFDRLTYNGWVSAAYAELHTPNQPPPPAETTQQSISTVRLDTTNELSMPFAAGPFKIVPYGIGDLTYYSEDLNGTGIGRAYGALGLRASIPFTRLYPDIQSDLLNLDGIMHKIVASANLFYARSSVPFTELPQLDMLNDPITDQSLRDMRANPFLYPNPATGVLLSSSPLFDPQYYALHQLLMSNIDTLDNMDAIELDLRQRWQTKRGYPGNEHIVDWMTLDVSATFFPDDPRGNGGVNWGFFDYDWTWNIGDRTALVSSGLFEPVENGARVWSVGAFINRPDRTSFYLGYRQIDPLQSKAVTAAVTYIFSAKYAVTGSTTYDFGTQASLSNSLIFTRMGSDLQINAGITYNALLNTFGVTFEIIPNVANAQQRALGQTAFGSSSLGR